MIVFSDFLSWTARWLCFIQYFKRVDGQYPGSKLLDPQGALAQEVPSRAISVENTEVALLQQAGGAKVSTRGMYLKMSSEKKAEIGSHLLNVESR